MTKLKGQNLDLNASIIRKGTNKSAKDRHGDIAGEMVDFGVSVVKKSKGESSSSLTGTNLNFTINQIGRWAIVDKKPSACMICKLPIKEHQRVEKCPMCDNVFHDDHIFEWLKVKGKCPVCQQSLRPGGTVQVKL